MHMNKNIKIGVIGLGYVGLPLAVEFGKRYETVGYDLNPNRICDLQSKIDRNCEVSAAELSKASCLSFTCKKEDLSDCNFYIVTVPTPIDEAKRPDLRPLLSACKLVGSVLKVGDIVVFESTVYPGATEEECVPVLEKVSGMVFNVDFYCGYSPERINPGDHSRDITSIVKVTSGSTSGSAATIDTLYRSIITAGTHLAPSIKVAEAAKVIENTQRDLNIALINELSIIFNRIGIDTSDVLSAASTKWNFIPFVPGLVGGHCIGVDPYYLTHKAEMIGYHPQVILAGRRINDSMGEYIGGRLVRHMVKRSLPVHGGRILILGFAFKENCSDIRNTKVLDLVSALESYGAKVEVFDPLVDQRAVNTAHDITMISEPETGAYDAIILAVVHDQFKEAGVKKIRKYGNERHVFYDMKSVFLASESDIRA